MRDPRHDAPLQMLELAKQIGRARTADSLQFAAESAVWDAEPEFRLRSESLRSFRDAVESAIGDDWADAFSWIDASASYLDAVCRFLADHEGAPVGRGPTVVLLHGIPGQGRAWDHVQAALEGRFDAIVPDLIGFGDSDRPPRPTIDNVGPTAQATHVATLLDELGVRHATIVGHDFGAPVSVLLAAMRPDLAAAISLLAGNTFPDTPIPFPLSLTTAPIIGGLFSRLLFSTPSLTLMLRQGTGRGSAAPDAELYLGDRGQRRTIATIFSGALTGLAELYAPVAAALQDLEVPVFVGWGEHDPFFPLREGERIAAAADARLHVFDGAGHFLPHERPDEVAHEIATLATAVST